MTRPFGAEATFGVRPALLRGRAVELTSAWPAARELRAALSAADGPAAKLALIDDHLVDHVRPSVPGLDRCEQAVALLEADPTRPIREIAADVGVSHAHLDRELTRIVGLSPRTLARLLRMRRLLATMDVRGDVSWSGRAAELGWFDQAHLIRDFKRHTGVTPSAYLAAQRATYTTVAPGDAAGFVPEA